MNLEKLISGKSDSLKYKNGFLSEKGTTPFYSFLNAGDPVHGWTDDLAESLKEHSRDHFIDVYNRKLAVDGIRDAMVDEKSVFIDIGCSSGYIIEDVKKTYPKCEIYGADYVGAGLKHCHDLHPDVPLFQMDLTQCPFAENSFSAVTCLNVLEHIEDDRKALSELHRVLRPGGRLVVTVPTGKRLYDLYDEVHHHSRRYELGELLKQMKDAGFKVIESNYFGSLIYPAFYFVKKTNQWRYRDLSAADKKKVVFSQIQATEQSKVMGEVFKVENKIGKVFRYPFGIRAYVVVTKI